MGVFVNLIVTGGIWAKYGIVPAIVYFFLYLFTTFGCCQIVGSIQNFHFRTTGQSFATIIIWLVLMYVGYLIFKNFFPVNIYYIALGVGFLTSITSGHIS